MSVLSSQFSPGNPSRSISNSNWNNPKRGNFILRQELISYTPECSATCGMIMNTLLFFIFGTIGILIVASSRSIIEYKFEYTDWYLMYNILVLNLMFGIPMTKLARLICLSMIQLRHLYTCTTISRILI